MDFIRQLSIFVAVVETGSFARAADRLRMARPGVTKAIGDLELDVGARLLQRTTRRSSLTGEGELLYQRATVLLSDVADTQSLFGGSGERPRGRLRIDIPVALAKPLVIPALPMFRATYPDIEIVLGVSDQPVDLVGDAVDCVLRMGPLPASSMIARRLAWMPMVICASPAYLAKHGRPGNMSDLQGHEAVGYFSGRGHRPIPWSIPSADGDHKIALPSPMSINDTEALVACALGGMGLIQVPGLFVADFLASGALVTVLDGADKVRWPLSIMYPNRHYLAPQVRVFMDWMAQVVMSKQGPWLDPS